MAIIQCPECGRDVSTEAKNCPQCGFPIRRDKSRPARVAAIVVAAVAALAAAAVACWKCGLVGGHGLTEREAWAAVERQVARDDPDSLAIALDCYFDAFPDGKYLLQAQTMKKNYEKELADWTRLLNGSLTRATLESFLYDHPEGFFRSRAMARMDSIDYAAAVDAGTPEAFYDYLERYPSGRFVGEAKARLAKTEVARLSEAEEGSAKRAVAAHFDALSANSGDIASTVASALAYMGKEEATPQDVLDYMERTHAGGEEKHFETSGMAVTKSYAGSVPMYNVRFRLVETIVAADADSACQRSFEGEAALNADYRITALRLHR